MKFMFQMRSGTQLGLLLLLAAAKAAAGDYCSLTVQVSDGHGNKPTGVTVKLTEFNGRVEIETTKTGEAKFCDLGSSGVDLTIGEPDHCNEVVVRNVAMSWGVEKTVNVIHNRDYCNEDELTSVGCRMFLRFLKIS